MNRLVDRVARSIALVAAVSITALTIFIHAADRTQLGAPEPTSTTVAQSPGSRSPTNTQAAQRVVALTANDQH